MHEEKRGVQHSKYPWLRVDMRTQSEVEESRNRKANPPMIRLVRRARQLGHPFEVNRDLDGAYRIGIRLDGRPGKAT